MVGALVNLASIAGGTAAFALLVVGALPQGFTYACTNNLRFAVMQFTTPEFAPRAIAMVIAGGVFSAGVGPEASKYTRTSMDKEFLGSYVLLTCIYSVMLLVPLLIDFHQKFSPEAHTDTGEQTATGKYSGEHPVAAFKLELAETAGAVDEDSANGNSVQKEERGSKNGVPPPDCAAVAVTSNIELGDCDNIELEAVDKSPVPCPPPPPPRDLKEIAFNWPFLYISIKVYARALFILQWVV